VIIFVIFSYPIQKVLDWTAKFVTKRDENSIKLNKTKMSIQRPEYIQREFNPNFLFSNDCLYDKYRSWTQDEKLILATPWMIWKEIYDIVFANSICGHS